MSKSQVMWKFYSGIIEDLHSGERHKGELMAYSKLRVIL